MLILTDVQCDRTCGAVSDTGQCLSQLFYLAGYPVLCPPYHPLALQASGQRAATLRRRFDDVQPTLLMFLQKLQCIVITDSVTGTSSVMLRWVGAHCPPCQCPRFSLSSAAARDPREMRLRCSLHTQVHDGAGTGCFCKHPKPTQDKLLAIT